MTATYWLCTNGDTDSLAVPYVDGDTEAHVLAVAGHDRARLVDEDEARRLAPDSPCFCRAVVRASVAEGGMSPLRYAVTGDHARLVYSQHRTREAAERAARHLARQWGWSHPGSEPRVVEVESRLRRSPWYAQGGYVPGDDR